MKLLLFLIVICVIGYFGWSYLNPTDPSEHVEATPAGEITHAHVTLSPPHPLPNGKIVNDQIGVLTIGDEVFHDVTVRTVYPDSISIFHRDGATTIEFSKVSKEIQDKYSFDPDAADAYASLKAQHVQYNSEHRKSIEAAKNTPPTEQSVSTTQSTPETSQPSQTNSTPIPGTLENLISYGDEKLARTEFEKYLRTASRLEARGTIVRHLDGGHLLVRGSIGNPETRGMSYNQTYLLFGLPEADRLADGDTFNAFVIMGDSLESATGSRIREYIYVDEGGSRPARFPMNSEMYD